MNFAIIEIECTSIIDSVQPEVYRYFSINSYMYIMHGKTENLSQIILQYKNRMMNSCNISYKRNQKIFACVTFGAAIT